MGHLSAENIQAIIMFFLKYTIINYKLVLIVYFSININNNTINKVIIKQTYVLIQYVNRPS